MTTYILIGLTLIVVVLLALIFSRQQESVIRLESRLESLEKGQERTERGLRDEIAKNREELGKNISELTRSNEEKLEKIRGVVESQLKFLQEDNNIKLERIRETVDEKLSQPSIGDWAILSLVSERLEKSIRVRRDHGGWRRVWGFEKSFDQRQDARDVGELQLEILLEQILTPEQYEKYSHQKGSRDPWSLRSSCHGHDQEPSIFRSTRSSRASYQDCRTPRRPGRRRPSNRPAALSETRVKAKPRISAISISTHRTTTDFGILFLSTEGLYARSFAVRIIRNLASGLPRHYHRPNHLCRPAQQPADGVSDIGRREARRGGLESPGDRQNRIWKIRRDFREDQRKVEAGQQNDRRRGQQIPHDREKIAPCSGIAR